MAKMLKKKIPKIQQRQQHINEKLKILEHGIAKLKQTNQKTLAELNAEIAKQEKENEQTRIKLRNLLRGEQ